MKDSSEAMTTSQDKSMEALEVNSPAVAIDLFLYGHLIDPAILRARGLTATAARQALLPDYALRIGKSAYLMPSPGDSTPGIVYLVNASGAQALFECDETSGHFVTSVLLELTDGSKLPAVTLNVAQHPDDDPPDHEYAELLCQTLRVCGVDDAHVRRALLRSIGPTDI